MLHTNQVLWQLLVEQSFTNVTGTGDKLSNQRFRYAAAYGVQPVSVPHSVLKGSQAGIKLAFWRMQLW